MEGQFIIDSKHSFLDLVCFLLSESTQFLLLFVREHIAAIWIILILAHLLNVIKDGLLCIMGGGIFEFRGLFGLFAL